MSGDGAIQVMLRVRYEFPEDGPGTMLIMAPKSDRWLGSVKAARIRLPESGIWVVLDGPELCLDLDRDLHILGLGTYELSQGRRAFLELKSKLRIAGGDRIVVEFEEIGGHKTLCTLVSDESYKRSLARQRGRAPKRSNPSGVAKIGA